MKGVIIRAILMGTCSLYPSSFRIGANRYLNANLLAWG
jgi:hypothetical protein